MNHQEKQILSVFLNSALILAALITFPVGLISAVFGPITGLLAFGVAIPLSAHVGGAVPLGATSEEIVERFRDRAEVRLFSTLMSLCVLFGINLLMVIPDEIRQVPVLSILICSFYVMALYLLGARGGPPDRVLSRIGGPVVAVIVLTLVLV
jgi:hypothetical protein